jgi:hypothetical protein
MNMAIVPRGDGRGREITVGSEHIALSPWTAMIPVTQLFHRTTERVPPAILLE